jgi:predicted ATPase/Tfp pilus assembly protein PilF
MNSERWERIQTLFEEALAQPNEARSAFIESACGTDVELRNELVSLLGIRLRPENRQAHKKDDRIHELPRGWLGTLVRPKPHRFAAGERIAGRYLVHRLLGKGGMGEVYEAWDEELAIPVALKTLHLSGGDAVLQRLKLESLLARSVSHPNVCRVYDLGRHAEGKATVWFLTMEQLHGETLAQHLRKVKVLPLDRALRIAEQMAAGLGAAHQSGVVHRDFKADNVMLVGQGATEQAIVMDFGLSMATTQGQVLDVVEGRRPAIFGTPAYMAPEQLQGGAVGPEADIYALGIVLFEMVTGTLPFSGPSAFEVARQRLETDPPSPRTLVPELDVHWETVILRCLAREPGSRFRRVEEVADALAGRQSVLVGQSNATRSQYTLPVERNTFVGREPEIEALGHQLAGDARLVTLLGAAGMGKTRLAVRYAAHSLGAWPGGVWFCDLTDARSLDGIVSAVAFSLGIQLQKADPIDHLGDAIEGHGRCLVILDNCEQAVDLAATVVDRWLKRAKGAKFLVTSRERLELGSKEYVLRVEPLSAELGVELFESRARWLRPGLTVEGGEKESIREAVRLLDGIPLAIELAAARMRVMSATQIVAQMRKRFHLLTGGPGVRHETLAAAIDGSWEMLHDWEKMAWAQCSVFEGGFTLDAAEAILDLTKLPERPWVVDAIQSLVDKSLLRTWITNPVRGEGTARARFGMYGSLQDYARLKLRDASAIATEGSGPEAERAAEVRHGTWFAAYGTDEAIDALDAGGVARRWQLERELDNLMTACRRAVARGDGLTSVATYRASWSVLEMRGPYGAALELGHQVLANKPLDSEARAKALATLGQAELRSGRLDEAKAHFEDALAIHRAMGNRYFEALGLAHLGGLCFQGGQLTEALTRYETALAIARDIKSRRLEGQILANLGALHASQGRMQPAESAFEAALTIHREMRNRRFEGMVLTNLGVLRSDQGRMAEAKVFHEAALPVHREVGNRRFEGLALIGLGGLHFHHDELNEARSSYEAAMITAREIGNKELEGIAVESLGHVLTALGQLDEAHMYFEAGLILHRQVHNRRYEASALRGLGDVMLQHGCLSQAREAFAESEAVLRQLDDRIGLGRTLCSRAELELRSGDLAAARSLLAKAEVLAAKTGSGPDSNLGRRVVEIRAALAVPRSGRAAQRAATNAATTPRK